MKIMTVIGARPQFIKASSVSRAINDSPDLHEMIVHTGQHFDPNMSDVFFRQLDIPSPDYQLDIHGGSHAAMTGRMMEKLEAVMVKERPDRVMVYGDTNSTLAGALAASKLHIPIAHIEAGLRSFNRKMPEEINRILTDQLCDLLLCPTRLAVENLMREGFDSKTSRIENVGDVMQDSAIFFAQHAIPPNGLADRKAFVLSTLHRAENTDDPERLSNIIYALNEINDQVSEVILPLHPRTRIAIEKQGLPLKVTVIEPVGYFEMVWLLNNSGLVLTDSGGVQKEAFFFGKPCVTVRDQTEWMELIDIGANILAQCKKDEIISAVRSRIHHRVKDEFGIYGAGKASRKIVSMLESL